MRIFVVLLVTSLALAACGRRGGLEPPGAGAAGQPGIPQSGATTGADTATAEEKPDPPFILDALI